MRAEERDTPEGKKVGGETHKGKQRLRETLIETSRKWGEIKTETGRQRKRWQSWSQIQAPHPRDGADRETVVGQQQVEE